MGFPQTQRRGSIVASFLKIVGRPVCVRATVPPVTQRGSSGSEREMEGQRNRRRSVTVQRMTGQCTHSGEGPEPDLGGDIGQGGFLCQRKIGLRGSLAVAGV